MTQPPIVTQLRAEAAETEHQVETSAARLAAARARLLPLVGTIRLFDPEHAGDQPPTACRGANEALRSRELFALCGAAMAASEEPLETRRLARHVAAMGLRDKTMVWRLSRGARAARCRRAGRGGADALWGPAGR